MEVGSVTHGFKVTNVRELKESDGVLYEMEYLKNGAKLCFFQRDDNNKAFSIAFKTIPEDSTGVFHIIEHSVMAGSRKYPVKDPFVELLKTSVNTFLNAMTYPDKTVYPFSSRNNQDFLNLMDIYLDAVLHPRIYENPEVFEQEGWRYEIDEDNHVQYQGVVLNEMKGAYSSYDTVMENAMNRVMFPDTPYRYESGGYPIDITDLTYKQFIASHAKYYHPSNARITLVGDVDIDAALAKIDGFLGEFERLDETFDIPMQGHIPYQELVVPYEIGADETMEGHVHVSCGYHFGRFDEDEKLYATLILQDYLAGDNEAPLKNAILAKNLGKDVAVNVHGGIQQNWISWDVYNTEQDNVEKIKETVDSVLRGLVENGLDKERLKASYSSLAFTLRDKDGGMPRSLVEALSMLDSWLYDGDPAQYLVCEEALALLEEKLDTDYYGQLLKELFLDNEDKAMAILVPDKTLGEVKLKEEADKIASIVKDWTPIDYDKKKQEMEHVRAWQQEENTPEQLATMPVLKLSDVSEKPEDLTPMVACKDGVTVLSHKNNSPLVFVNWHFDASDLSLEQLPLLTLMFSLLGKLATVRHSAEQIQLLVKQEIGRLRFFPTVRSNDTEKCRVFGCVNAVALSSRQEKASELVVEILRETKFTDVEAVRNIINQIVLDNQMSLVQAGNQFAVARAKAALSASGVASEMLSGTHWISWMKERALDDDKALLALMKKVADLAKELLVKNRLTLSVNETCMDASAFIKGLPYGDVFVAKEANYAPLAADKVGVAIPAPVGYAAKVAKLDDFMFKGSCYVLQKVLNFSYLWNEIRVLGGAYGTGFSISDTGEIAFHSYRDPKPARSLGVYDKAAEFIEKYCQEVDDLTPLILGSFATADPLLNAAQKIAVAEGLYFKKIKYETRVQRRKQLLETTPGDLLEYVKYIKEIAKQDLACVVAGQNLLDTCDSLETFEQVL